MTDQLQERAQQQEADDRRRKDHIMATATVGYTTRPGKTFQLDGETEAKKPSSSNSPVAPFTHQLLSRLKPTSVYVVEQSIEACMGQAVWQLELYINHLLNEIVQENTSCFQGGLFGCVQDKPSVEEVVHQVVDGGKLSDRNKLLFAKYWQVTLLIERLTQQQQQKVDQVPSDLQSTLRGNSNVSFDQSYSGDDNIMKMLVAKHDDIATACPTQGGGLSGNLASLLGKHRNFFRKGSKTKGEEVLEEVSSLLRLS